MLKLVLLIEIIFLLGNAVVISRDHQDSWVLEGLEIPFAVFMITYTVSAFFEKKLTWMVLLAVICRSVILLIPNLKYEWFLGTSIDQNVHFRLTRFIHDTGHVESGTLYADTPLMQIFFATYSKITSVSVLHTFKYLPILSWLVYPLMIYLVTKRVFIKKNPSLIKYAVFISSIPIMSEISYIVSGSFFGVLLVFLFLSQFTKVLRTNSRKDWIVAIIFSLALVVTHSFSSTLLVIGFLTIFLANKLFRFFSARSRFFKARAFSSSLLMFLVVLNAAWFLHLMISGTVLGTSIEVIVHRYVNAVMGLEVTAWTPTGFRPRFFELNLIDQLRVLTVLHGADIILLLLLSSFGIIVVAKKFRLSKSLKFLFFYLVSLGLYYPITMLFSRMQAGLIEYTRILRYASVLSPIFIGIFFYYVKTRLHKGKPMILASLLVLITLATVQLYGYQPLIPPSSAISADLPSDEPVVYLSWVGVNSAYQRYMIRHAEKHVGEETVIACDIITQNQIIGLADYDFSPNHLAEYYPFSRLLDDSIIEVEHDYFLIHLPGKSGAFGEKAEIRTRSLIIEAINNSSIVYSNGESYILSKPFFD